MLIYFLYWFHRDLALDQVEAEQENQPSHNPKYSHEDKVNGKSLFALEKGLTEHKYELSYRHH
jgi:hypothetical protein